MFLFSAMHLGSDLDDDEDDQDDGNDDHDDDPDYQEARGPRGRGVDLLSRGFSLLLSLGLVITLEYWPLIGLM